MNMITHEGQKKERARLALTLEIKMSLLFRDWSMFYERLEQQTERKKHNKESLERQVLQKMEREERQKRKWEINDKY